MTGGSPWGTVLGSDGAIYVTQGGNVPGSGDTSAVSGIQRVQPDGTVELLFSEVAGYELYGPNDLAFGPDGRLWFTESGSEQDFRFDVRAPGRLYVAGPDGTGEMVLERPDVYPNGIAFDAQQRLYWTESAAHRVCRLEDGEAVTFCQLPATHVPDGMAFAADGRLFVCTTISQGVTVVSPDGVVLEEISLGEHATNCIFDGSDLYVTATKVPDIEASQRTGIVLAGRDRRHRPGPDPRPALAGSVTLPAPAGHPPSVSSPPGPARTRCWPAGPAGSQGNCAARRRPTA